MISWQFEDDLGVCQVRVSQRGKTQIKLRVRERHLIEISAPKQVSAQRLRAFVSEHQHWLYQQRLQLSLHALPQQVWYLGQPLPIQMRPVNSNIILNQHECVLADNLAQPYLSLLQHLQDAAATILLPRLRALLPEQYAQLDVRLSAAHSYWGICRPQQIKLNWRLIGAPVDVIDYVCVHEICHLAHPNHSAAFWQAVAARMPDYREQRLWLKQHGTAIMQSYKSLNHRLE
ncbi:M48 family metallopeptidase [Vitreoscilla massiliensis]|uniref:M48 family metallopeptidase n=1 Tax=Vitreoscilla massiliensis TaxID=1689272 RepID=A0ABY4E4D1_9NEIS|nr:YgjP-like metallopeptidase domain-containing protein [Vitreoscilla massiliensis]UOO90362.1 M48 family metallopeptidase [Vitreoscilla massiliensis]